jgi:hypothetical protein
MSAVGPFASAEISKAFAAGASVEKIIDATRGRGADACRPKDQPQPQTRQARRDPDRTARGLGRNFRWWR